MVLHGCHWFGWLIIRVGWSALYLATVTPFRLGVVGTDAIRCGVRARWVKVPRFWLVWPLVSCLRFLCCDQGLLHSFLPIMITRFLVIYSVSLVGDGVGI